MLRQLLLLKYAYTSICTHPPTHIYVLTFSLYHQPSLLPVTHSSLTFALLCTFTIATLTACMCSANTQHLLPCYHSHVCPHLPPAHTHTPSLSLARTLVHAHHRYLVLHSQSGTDTLTTLTYLQPHNWNTQAHSHYIYAATCPQTFPYIHTHTTTLKHSTTHNFMLPTQDHSFSVILSLVANLTTWN